MREVIGGLVLLSVVGCGSGAGGRGTVRMPELGLTMQLPDGWRAGSREPWSFYDADSRDENWGRVDFDSLKGKALDEYVQGMTGLTPDTSLPHPPLDQELRPLDTRHWRIEPCQIDGREAIEVVSEAATMMSEVFIKKDDQVIRVSFVTTREAHPNLDAAFRGAFDSIKFE